MTFYLFNKGNRIIGYNGEIYEQPYIDEALSIGNYKATTDRDIKIREYVHHLASVQSKLARNNKYFLVYITPSKGFYKRENIPDKFLVQSRNNSIRASDVLRDELSKLGINVFDSVYCIPTEREWPLFYTTGIHWSRPIEQLSNIELINRLAKLSGKNFHNNSICGLNSSNLPFWRDTDVYDLLNIWQKIPDNKFYEFFIEDDNMAENGDPFDELKMLIQGGSYSEGIIPDHFSYYVLDDRYLLFYNSLERQTDNSAKAIKNNDWNNVDLQGYLDTVDFVVIEINESAIGLQSNGFVEYLDNFLDTYHSIPRMKLRDYVFSPEKKVGLSDSRNFYRYEGSFSWCAKNSYVGLKNAQISQTGLSIKYVVPEEIFDSATDVDVVVRVNGYFIKKKKYKSFMQEDICIYASDLPKTTDDVYKIELCCSTSFNPKKLGMSDDDRDLALMVQYIGEME